MSPRALAVALLLGAVLSGSAHADTLRSYVVHDEPELRAFRIESPGQTDDICILYPSQIGNCEGLNPEQAKKDLLKSIGSTLAPVALGVIRTPMGRMFVAVGAIPKGAAGMSAEAIAATAENLRLQLGAEPEAHVVIPPHRTQIRGHEAIELSYDGQTNGKVTEESMTYLFFGRDRTHQLLFEMDSEVPGAARLLVDHMLTTLDYAPGDLGAFGQPKISGGGGFGVEWLLTMPGAFFVAAFALWWRRTRGRSGARPPTADGSAPTMPEAKPPRRRKRLRLRSALTCPHCEAASNRFREVEGALICPNCGRSFQRESA